MEVQVDRLSKVFVKMLVCLLFLLAYVVICST